MREGPHWDIVLGAENHCGGGHLGGRLLQLLLSLSLENLHISESSLDIVISLKFPFSSPID